MKGGLHSITIGHQTLTTAALAEGAILNEEFAGFREDYLVLHCLCRALAPRVFFEVGTNHGTGTNIVAHALGPAARVLSLELPDATSDAGPLTGSACQRPFTQLHGDSRHHDFSAHHPIEGWFIDGGHFFENVLIESRAALASRPRLVVWHDADISEVWRALAAVFEPSDYRLFRVTGTRIAFAVPPELAWRVPGGGEPRVSAIICSYNRYDGLLRALASVRAQTFRAAEIIVVNDGSTDPRYRTAPRPADVIWIDQAENTRARFGFPCLGHVKNVGLARATGEWVAFLDDDDEWLPGKLAAQIAAVRATGCRMCATEAWRGEGTFDAQKKYPRYLAEWTKHDRLPEKFTLADIARDNLIIHSSALIERALVAEMGGYDELPLGGVMRDGRLVVEDWELWQRCLRATDCAFVRAPQVYYDGAHGRAPVPARESTTTTQTWWRRLIAPRA
jgi:Glycosyl transferase family 2